MELSKINDLDQLKKLWAETQKQLDTARKANSTAYHAHENARLAYDKMQVLVNKTEYAAGKPLPAREPTDDEKQQLIDLNFIATELDVDKDYRAHVMEELDSIATAIRVKIRVVMLQKSHPELDIDTVRKIAVPQNVYTEIGSYQGTGGELPNGEQLGFYEQASISDDLFKSAIG